MKGTTAPGRFASRYKLFLPDEKRLEKEMMREVRLLTGEKYRQNL
jgi:hypothetical protein